MKKVKRDISVNTRLAVAWMVWLQFMSLETHRLLWSSEEMQHPCMIREWRGMANAVRHWSDGDARSWLMKEDGARLLVEGSSSDKVRPLE